MQFGLERLGIYARKSGFARTWRPPKYEREPMLLLNSHSKRLSLPYQVFLTNELIKRLRPDSRG